MKARSTKPANQSATNRHSDDQPKQAEASLSTDAGPGDRSRLVGIVALLVVFSYGVVGLWRMQAHSTVTPAPRLAFTGVHADSAGSLKPAVELPGLGEWLSAELRDGTRRAGERLRTAWQRGASGLDRFTAERFTRHFYPLAINRSLDDLEAGRIERVQRRLDRLHTSVSRRWEVSAIRAVIQARRGDDEALETLRLARVLAAGWDRAVIQTIESRWARQAEVRQLLEEADRALVDDHTPIAIDRLGRAMLRLSQQRAILDTRPPVTAPIGGVDREALFRLLAGARSDVEQTTTRSLIARLTDRASVDIAEPASVETDAPARSDLQARRLLANARESARAGRRDAALRALDEVLRLNPGHNQARAMVEQLWQPEGELAESLHELVRCARSNDFSAVLVEPLTHQDVLQPRAARVRLGGDETQRASVVHDQSGRQAITVMLSLGEYQTQDMATRVYYAMTGHYRDHLAPGWTTERVSKQSTRLSSPSGDVAIDMDLILVQYDLPKQSVLAELSIQVSQLNEANAVASMPQPGATGSSDES